MGRPTFDFPAVFCCPEELASERNLCGTRERKLDWGPNLRDKAVEMLMTAAGK